MTREEAISIMKVIVHMLEEKYDTDRVEEAVDMAIEALSAEPCDKCIYSTPSGECQYDDIAETVPTDKPCEMDDLILRQDVLDACEQSINIIEAVDRIMELPSVNPQRPKSEWEHDHEILKAYSDGANEALDNIRAEIESLKPCQGCFYDGVTKCLEIIDRYRAESEDQK